MRFTRVTLIFIACIIAVGFYQLARHFLAEVEPQTFQATEEMMIESAQIFAGLIGQNPDGNFDTSLLENAIANAHDRSFEARIFDHLKTKVGLHVYLTNEKGIVVFDSDRGQRVGQDFSRMNDVARTLSGHYGARSSREDSKDSSSSVLFVAAPIGNPLHPVGVLTVYKPQRDMLPLVHKRQRIIITACGLIGCGIIFLIGAVFLWLFRPIGKITEYARAIERGQRPAKPKIGIGREVNTLARALDSMRDALENRKYVERYLQTLTHEMKSPLAAIRGAAELMDEEMPVENRRRFLGNIRSETLRSERLINRLLELSAIENRTSLETAGEVDFREIVAQSIEQARSMAELAAVALDGEISGEPLLVCGDAFILRAAVTNLLENAIDFSPANQTIHIQLEKHENLAKLLIRDHGAGIPDYAREKVFERFYSLRHHNSRRKGTGLGLTLVKEAAELHGGTISLEPAEGGGTLARLALPNQ